MGVVGARPRGCAGDWRRPCGDCGRVAPPPPTSFAPVALTSLPGSEGSPDLSPDGSQVVFTWTREGAPTPDIYVQLIGAGATPLRLTDDGSAHGLPVWAPDGKSIAFWHASLNCVGR